MSDYRTIAELPQMTVVADYQHEAERPTAYQSEADMERDFIDRLERQGYQRLHVHSEADLIRNMRERIGALNGVTFSDAEWHRLFDDVIANPQAGILEKTRTVQEDHVKVLRMDDGSDKNIYLFDKRDVHRNALQVMNQYVPEGGARANRYDVTILVNGFPLVHVELKRRGVDIREAFNQIERYGRESFWAGSGLFDYVQVFVISNGTFTKYYSNTTRRQHVDGVARRSGRGPQTSNSFEFTSYWADATNRPLFDIRDFTATFFLRHTLLSVLFKYCVLTSENLLLVMRPYQIAATEALLLRVMTALYNHWEGTIKAGGYIWHTTGSGKTLTSFKAARLASRMAGIDKVIFVVDRKDLDYQTMREYDRFEKGAANGSRSTAILEKNLKDPDKRILITTIQKLMSLINKHPGHEIYSKKVVLIFDECHRSQFGLMHKAIARSFKKYFIFGFTGTPIFPVNAIGNTPGAATTEQVFGDRLHAYTIVDAINDGNVLPFKVDYVKTMKMREGISDEQVEAIDREAALRSPQHVSGVVGYILSHYDQKTLQASHYMRRLVTNVAEVARGREVQEKTAVARAAGFNSIFAVESIPMAMLYYDEFKRQQAPVPEGRRLKVGLIYSFAVNDEADDGSGLPDDENSDSAERLPQSQRDFLDAAIMDYNLMFGTTYDTSSERFQNYYKDVSLRMKNRELDILIVVNMFLTGFDATTLNTLWVDKNLRMHGLLQAYSRTNRILNSVKRYGNIVCFRDLEKATDESFGIFGNRDAAGVVLMRTFRDYYEGYDDEDGKHHKGYREIVGEILEVYPQPGAVMSEKEEKAFIALFGAFLKAQNILAAFDEFEGKELMTAFDEQDYRSWYIDLHEKYRRSRDGEAVNVNDDIVFEMELIKRVEINIDYILQLIEKYRDRLQDAEVELTIRRSVDSSPNLRSKRELIERFIASMTPEADVTGSWQEFVERQRKADLDAIIGEENLKKEETYRFMTRCFKDGGIRENGTELTAILPPMPLFGGGRAEKKRRIIERLKEFYSRYADLGEAEFTM